MIICVDPGSRKAGVALFETTGRLTAAWLATGDNWKETADDVRFGMPVSAVRVSQVVVEKMQWYPENPVPVEDLIILSLMAGRVGGLFASSVLVDGNHEYLPRTWKKQVPKKIMIERIKAKLSKDEHSRVKLPKDKKQQLDVYDAIGIGLWALGRR